MSWIIEHKIETDDAGRALVWSNNLGWISGDNFDTFDDNDRAALNLPIDGEWTRVDWVKFD